MMTKDEFLQRMQDDLMLETLPGEQTLLCNIEGWDSLAMLNMLALFDELAIDVDVSDLETCRSVDELLKKAKLV